MECSGGIEKEHPSRESKLTGGKRLSVFKPVSETIMDSQQNKIFARIKGLPRGSRENGGHRKKRKTIMSGEKEGGGGEELGGIS